MKKPSQIRQPTPVLSAMRSIRFIVPRNRFRVPSKLSFIFSAKAVESRISSPIATVIFATRQRCPHVPRQNCLPDLLMIRTSFSIRTFFVISLTCSSFWLSSSSITASLYCPFRFGVADLKPPSPSPLRLPTVSPFAPGYALKPAPVAGCPLDSFCVPKAYGELLLACSVE